ncbi:MAG: aldo/keto reductase [Gemmatimonadetes bacterium]|nr:MAG: aldo/keto reductase [Gemmatimonadota bacterium]
MQYHHLGQCGTRVSQLSLGGWTTFGGSVKEHKLIKTILHAAFDAGVNFYDIADIYAKGESERAMGKVLRDFPRHELVISSKVYFPMSEDVNDRGLSRKHIMESIDKSLARIGTDYLDIYFCHRPDPHTPIEETVRAMDDLVHQGKILYWGASEWTGAQLECAHGIADKRNLYAPQVEQPQYSLLARYKFEKDLLPVVRSRGMGTVIWSPLASGVLTGKYDSGIPEDSRLARMDWLRDRLYQEDILSPVRQMKTIADELGCSRAQLALAWALAQEGVSSVIMGATKLEQLQENLGALAVNLSEEIRARLNTLFPPKPVSI